MFRNRKDAGEQLGSALEHYRGQNAIVIGIPRGGVETAYYVAKHLDAELSVVITRKLGYPGNPEAAFGAIAEDGSIYISRFARLNLSPAEIDRVTEEQKKEIVRRTQKLRKGRPLPDLSGRTVIIVDDGIATGATLFATIELCKNQTPSKLVVAAPVSGSDMERTLRTKVDEVVILEKPPFYHAVSEAYDDFGTVSDDDALKFLEGYRKEFHHHTV